MIAENVDDEQRGNSRGMRLISLIGNLISQTVFFSSASSAFLAAQVCVVFLLVAVLSSSGFSQTNYEGLPISEVAIVLENSPQIQGVIDQFESIVRSKISDKFSAVNNREALQALFDSKRVASARIEVVESKAAASALILRFVVRRTTLIDQVKINVGATTGERITEAELLLRLNLLTTNAVITERAAQQSADSIQSYLREHGFFKATVEYSYTPPSQREARNNLTFNVTPNEQARVEEFNIKITGFDDSKIRKDLKLKPGEFYSREKLAADVERVRQALVKEDYLAAELKDPYPPTYDADKNTVSISLTGKVNSKVTVRIEDDNAKEISISERTQQKLLPIKREGQIDQSSIEEGRRRLKNKFQEDGYFFAEVSAVCGVEPFTSEDANIFRNNTQTACDFLDGLNLEGRKINVTYKAELNRRLKLTEIRLEGTDKLTIADVQPILQSQEANALGFIPRLGYGRGYTSLEILDEDSRVITSLMRELGYRRAGVRVRQGVTPAGDSLIITFVVKEGPLTRVSDVEITGNKVFTDAQLKQELPSTLVGEPFSRAKTRNGNNRILGIYARNGYFYASSVSSVVELPSTNPNEELVKIVYNVEHEGDKTFINRILIVGNTNTKSQAILQTIPLVVGDVLRADRITESERNLYATSVFQQVNITTEPAGTTADGNARRDVIIELQEDKQRLLTYGGGFSTDDGPNGTVDIRYLNLFGKLYQAGARVRASRRQQQVQFDFTNPRFLRESDGQFAPLTLTAQYLRDTGVTRFFRTTLDQGALGIVQRLDANGNPIDEFGAKTGVPSINRYSFNAETSRTINRATRSLLFLRYRFEEVQLLNIKSLLVAPLLLPDRNVRISGLGATFGRDTRQNCNNRRTLLETIRTGEAGNPCQYNATDPTTGDFLSLDYQLSARFLGGNTSFNKFQGTYQRYQQFDTKFGKLVLAGRAIFGLANIFQPRDRNGNGVIDETDKTLPISERFFAGGSTNLRGFDFEEAGPRQVIVPTGQFRDRNNNPVVLNPFTVPLGGNALAVINLEARIPVSSIFQVVPFYDGGNVFRRVSEIFKSGNSLASDIAAANLRAKWSNTFGLGIRLKTPIGGSLAVDYGYLLNPPQFLIPQQPPAPPAVYRLHQGRIHIRFTQAF